MTLRAFFRMTNRIRITALLILAVQSLPFATSYALDANADSSVIERPSEQKLRLQGSDEKAPPQIELPTLHRPVPDTLSTKELLHFTPRDFRFKGNTVFGDDELRALIKQFINTPINSIDLEEIRLIITNHYINHGYITSGAIIPDQDLLDGLLLIEIKEGTLSEIAIHNHGRLKPNFIKQRLSFKDQAIQLSTLQEKLYKLQREPSIKHINARLLPGDIRGRSTLDLDITEDKPYSLDIEYNNHRPARIGERQTILRFNHINLTGWGDALNAEFHRTSGMVASQLQYQRPVGIDGNSFYFSASQSNTELSEADQIFSQFSNDFTSIATGLDQTLLENNVEKYSVDWQLEHKKSYNSLPLQFCDGSGITTVNLSAFRLGQSLIYHPQDTYFSLRHTMSVGVRIFSSLSCAGNDSDRHFSSWLWQFLWAKRFSPYHLQAIVKGDMQLSGNSLLAFEKYSLGGANSVRGYAENLILRDQGRSLSFELRAPLRSAPYRWIDSMQLLGFVDSGQAWNNDSSGTEETLSSIGIGYRLYTRHAHLIEILWAKSLHETTQAQIDEKSLQDRGIHFRIKLNIK